MVCCHVEYMFSFDLLVIQNGSQAFHNLIHILNNYDKKVFEKSKLSVSQYK